MDKISVETMSLQDLQEHKDDLLAVGEVDPERLTRRKVLRSDIWSALFSARAVACLAELLVQRKWNRVFYLAGRRVFVRFEASDLLAEHGASVQIIARELERFHEWSELALRVVTSGGDLAGDPVRAGHADFATGSPRAGLDRFRRQHVGNGHSLHAIFLAWVRKVARASATTLSIGTVEGPMVRLRMPPRVQLLAPIPQPVAGGTSDVQSRAYQVLSTKRYTLVTTSSGKQLLLRKAPGSSIPAPGARVCYRESTARLVRAYYLMR